VCSIATHYAGQDLVRIGLQAGRAVIRQAALISSDPATRVTDSSREIQLTIMTAAHTHSLSGIIMRQGYTFNSA
jgi:hypothetical protein